MRRGLSSPAKFHPRRFARPRRLAPLRTLPTSPPTHTPGVSCPPGDLPSRRGRRCHQLRLPPLDVSRSTSRRQRGTRRFVVARCASRGLLVGSTVSASFRFPVHWGSTPPGLLLWDCPAPPTPVARHQEALQPRHASRLSKSSSSLWEDTTPLLPARKGGDCAEDRAPGKALESSLYPPITRMTTCVARSRTKPIDDGVPWSPRIADEPSSLDQVIPLGSRRINRPAPWLSNHAGGSSAYIPSISGWWRPAISSRRIFSVGVSSPPSMLSERCSTR